MIMKQAKQCYSNKDTCYSSELTKNKLCPQHNKLSARQMAKRKTIIVSSGVGFLKVNTQSSPDFVTENRIQ